MSYNSTTEISQHDTDFVTKLRGNHAFRMEITRATTEKKPCDIMILGIDSFKHINELYSYSFGDMVLKHFADEVSSILSSAIQLFRLDGDGFGLLHCNSSDGELEELYKKILSLAQTSRQLGGLAVSFSISAGICRHPEHGEDCDTLYRNARLALAAAKNRKQESYVYYSSELSKQSQWDLLLLDKIKKSVANNFEGFDLHFQPIIRNDTKEIDGCEALLRWNNPSFPEGVSPTLFVPVLENSGLILAVGRWVIETALKQCASWHKIMPTFKMNINVSARQFEEENFSSFVVEAFSKYHINPSTITLELTESVHVEFEIIQRVFAFLRKQGIQIALDDFGTGYASLDIFRSVSADELKIDRSFLERITYDVTDQILLKSIIEMCKRMDIIVCIEGIETSEMEHVVSLMEPELLQGYLYSRPISVEEFEKKYLNIHVAAMEKDEELSPILYSIKRPAKPMSLSEIVNNAYAGIFQVGMDKEFSFLTCNEGYRRMLGYTAKEIDENFRNKALEFVHPSDVDWVNQEIRRQLGEGDTVTIEFRIVRSDGRAIWILATGNVVRSSEGNPSLIINIIDNDVIKRKTLARFAQCDLYEKILNQLPAGSKYLRYDADFTIEYISPGLLSLLGYTQQEVFEQFEGKYINLICEEDRQQVIDDAQEQLKTSDIVHLCYRSPCKDGSIMWLDTVSRLCSSEIDGIQRCCSNVTNITASTTDEEKALTLNMAYKFQHMAEIQENITFQYNANTQKTVFSKNFECMLGYERLGNERMGLDIICEEDRAIVSNAIEQEKKGQKMSPFEVRIIKGDGKMLWCKVVIDSIEQIDGKVICITGKVNDIDEECKERESLENKSQRDSLTDLLNKSALERKITEMIFFATDEEYALWMIDIDGFKAINNTYGHFIGDKFLNIIAQKLEYSFRQQDVVGRFGGDEFMVFMQHTGEKKVLHEKAKKLMESLREPILIDGTMVNGISVSMGISSYPKDGKTFSELFQQVDKALYRVKQAGKGNFCIVG